MNFAKGFLWNHCDVVGFYWTPKNSKESKWIRSWIGFYTNIYIYTYIFEYILTIPAYPVTQSNNTSSSYPGLNKNNVENTHEIEIKDWAAINIYMLYNKTGMLTTARGLLWLRLPSTQHFLCDYCLQ